MKILYFPFVKTWVLTRERDVSVSSGMRAGQISRMLLDLETQQVQARDPKIQA